MGRSVQCIGHGPIALVSSPYRSDMAVRPAAPISGHSRQSRRKRPHDLMAFDSGGLAGLLLVGSVGGIRIQPAEVGRAEGARKASMHDQYVASDSWRIRAICARSAISEAARPPARLDAQSGLQCPAAFERPIDRGTIALRPPQTGCAARYFFGDFTSDFVGFGHIHSGCLIAANAFVRARLKPGY
jgi:hypothetical protein